jgi:hypothetical protein
MLFLACRSPLVVFGLAAMLGGTSAQSVSSPKQSTDGIWQAAPSIPVRRTDIAGPYAVARLNKSALDRQLARAPREAAPLSPGDEVVITLPLPDGRFSRFRIEETAMLAPELAQAFPEIKTYRGAGVDDPTATARLDWTSDGLHAMVIAAGGTVYIDPYAKGDLVTYISYNHADLRRTSESPR